MAKQELGWSELSGLALVSKQIDEMPESPEKEAMKSRYHSAFNTVLEHYDLPVRETTGRAALAGPALHVADYASGLTRTGINESLLAAQHAGRSAMGQPSSWSAEDAKGRALRALNPLDRPALNNEQYMDLGGVGDMGRVADAEGNYALTGKKALGFGLDMLEGPGALKGLAKLLGRGAVEAEAPALASTLRESEQAAKEASALAPSAGVTWGGVGNFAKGAAGAVADPLTSLRDAMLKYRFRHADRAVELAENGGKIVGRPKPSQIFQDSGAGGVTSNQIRQDMRSIVNQNSARIQGMTNEVGDIGDIGITRGTPQMAENPQLLDPQSAMYPLYSPEQAARERMPFQATEAQNARKALEQEYRAAAAGDQGIMRQLDEQGSVQGRLTHSPNGEILNDRQEFLPGMKPAAPSTLNVKGLMRGPDGEWVDTQKQIVLNSGDNIAVAPRVSSDPLSVDEYFTLPKVSEMAGAAQQKAATRKFFLSRDRFSPDAPQTPPLSREAMAAEGGMYAEQGKHLRGLQEDLMDSARPGLGGEAHRINQRTSSLLEGGSYLDRPKPTPAAGVPTSRSRSAFGGTPMMVLDKGMGALDVGAMGGYQALSNPWVSRGALPALKVYGLQQYWQNRMKPTYDEQGMPGGDNPWAQVYKYGGQQ